MTSAIVTFLLDRTGSMEEVRDDTIGAFNTYLDELQAPGAGGDILFTFLQFDSVSLDKVHVNTPVKDIPKLTRATYQPRAWTPLIDAVYKTIKAVEVAVGSDKSRKVVICIQTDGQENSSKEYTWEQLNALIKEKTELGWQFNFMGASLDAYAISSKMGVAAAGTMSYDKSNRVKTSAGFAASARNTRSYLSGQSINTDYSDSDRFASGDAFIPDDLKNPKKPPVSQPRGAAPVAKGVVDDFSL